MSILKITTAVFAITAYATASMAGSLVEPPMEPVVEAVEDDDDSGGILLPLAALLLIAAAAGGSSSGTVDEPD
jgi:hypothetical protein